MFYIFKLLFLILFSFSTWAGNISISLNKKHRGDPVVFVEDGFWRKQKLVSKALLSDKKSEFEFINFTGSPDDIFRSQIKAINGKTYHLNLSLGNYASVVRAKLLRSMGYEVEVPQFFKTLKLNFKSEREKKDFLFKIYEEIQTSKKRWIFQELKKSLILKSVVLENRNSPTSDLIWGVMKKHWQKRDRRLRPLLVPYLLTDYVENVNLISWEKGKKRRKKIHLSHPYAVEFEGINLVDFHWGLDQIAKLDRKEWKEIFHQSGYPDAVKELILEKTLSRLLSLIKKSKLKKKYRITYKKKLSNENIINGKLVSLPGLQDHALHFKSNKDDNPLLTSELYRFLGIRAFYIGFSSALNEIQKKIPFNKRWVGDRIEERIEEGKGANLKNLGIWTAPYLSGQIRASRSVVLGNYQGSKAPIHMIDTASIEFSGGFVGRGKPFWKKVIPGGSVGAAIIRTFTHIKAAPTIKAVNDYKFKNLYLPGLLKRTSDSIKSFACSVLPEPHVVEREIHGVQFFIIKFDLERDGQREKALSLKKRWIERGVSENSILIEGVLREKICKQEEKVFVDLSIDQFLNQFNQDETFTITDELRIGTEVHTERLFDIGVSASASVNAHHIRQRVRSYVIRKKENGFEVTFNRIKSRTNGVSMKGKLLIQLISGDLRGQKYKFKSNIYFVDLKKGSIEERKIALMTMKSLFKIRNSEIIEENYEPVTAEHSAKSRLSKFKFLFWSREKFRMHHDVSIRVKSLKSKKSEERTFHSSMLAKRRGRDQKSFVSQALNDISSGLFPVNREDISIDPGQSTGGKSSRFLVYSEVETTKGRAPRMLTRVQWGYRGSRNRPRKMRRILKKIKRILGKNSKESFIDLESLEKVNELNSYDVQANLVIQPKAHTRLLKGFSNISDRSKLDLLSKLYGKKKYEMNCEYYESIYVDGNELCPPDEIKEVYESLKELQVLIRKKDKSRIVNKIFYKLFNKFDSEKVLSFIGRKNWFFNYQIDGLKGETDENYVNYRSKTIGNDKSDRILGILDEAGEEYKITSYEIKALRFTPGFDF